MRILMLCLLALTAACGEVRSGDALNAIRAPEPPELPVVPELIDYHPDLHIAIAEMQMRDSGLLFQDDSVGTGDSVVVGSNVSVRYSGWLPDGTLFDTNRQDNAPLLSFQVGRGEMIEAFEEGVLGMRVGGRRKLVVPPALGYGESGSGPIPGNSVMVFEIEMVDIRP